MTEHSNDTLSNETINTHKSSKPMNRRKATHFVKARPGFALISTVMLMILLAILCVGMLGLSAVSLRSSSRDNIQAEAQANARMALVLALGRVQELAGDDRR